MRRCWACTGMLSWQLPWYPRAAPVTAPLARYRWFMGAFLDIAQKEGLRGLYSGVGANVGRASTLAAAEMATYDQFKPMNKVLAMTGVG
jgi:hypothetical protein